MLTATQVITIATGTSSPPWRVSDLLPIFKVQSLSLRAAIDSVTAAEVVIFLQVRNISLLTSSSSFEDFQAKWETSTPSVSTLKQLQNILNASGEKVRYQASYDYKTMGVSATMGDLSAVPGVYFNAENFDKAKASIDTGVGIEAGVLLAIFFATGPIGWGAGVVICGLSAYAGASIGYGIGQLIIGDDAQQAIPSPTVKNVGADPTDTTFTFPNPINLGPVPPGMPPNPDDWTPPILEGFCLTDADCPDGFSCIDGECLQIPITGNLTCKTDADCGEGYICVDGVCVPKGGCQTDADCPEGYSCIDGQCVPNSPPSGPGPDTGF